MKRLEFSKQFPDDESCSLYLKQLRESERVICRTCGCKHQYWNKSKSVWIYSKCGHQTALRSGTVMHGSNLPLLYWFFAIHSLTATIKTFSASEMQRQLGHKRYRPIWEMMHKLRSVMGKRNNTYEIVGSVELDEGFFFTIMSEEKKSEKLKAGAGSQRKTKVLIMAESTPEESPKNPKKPNKVKHIKMKVIADLKAETIDKEVAQCIDNTSTIITDASSSHVHLKDNFTEHKSQVIAPQDIEKTLPWVHMVISNTKSLLTDMYHGIKAGFLQGYLNEFCYKFNRKYFGERVFDRLIITAVAYKSDFQHRIYGRENCG